MIQITFKTDGTAQHVGDNSLLAGSIARATKKRASHVEPVNFWLRRLFHFVRWLDSFQKKMQQESYPLNGPYADLTEWTRVWPCLWRVKIVDGPVLPKLYSDRAEAIRDEIIWLEGNRL